MSEEEITKEKVLEYTKTCDFFDLYDVFDICRERHNNKMLEGRGK